MLPLFPVFLGLLAVLLAWHFLNVQRARSKLPPGPAPLPIIGNLGLLGFQIHHETLLKMASTYGNVYTIWLGHTPIVVLNGFQAVKEVLISRSEEFAERPVPSFLRDLIGDAHGILFSNGHPWKQQRRFSLMTLRNLGLGKTILEDSIRQEASGIIQAFTRENGRPIDPYSFLLSSVNNVIASMLFGHSFSPEETIFRQIIEGSRALEEFGGKLWARLYDVFPMGVGPLKPILNKSLLALRHWKKLQRIIEEEVQEHQKSWTSEEPRDFIDLYLAQVEKCKDDPTSTFTNTNMVQVVIELFTAGSDTSTVALYWALLYMMEYPEIQEQVQKELDTVLGSSHVIRYEDQKKLPFTNAVLHETQRVSSLSALGIMHKSIKDTNIKGMPIHKGVIVMPNIFSVHYDPEQWETPRKFNPGHFLDKDGNFIKKDAFILFSAGVRVCLGEKMARTTLFILFASLLRAFRFQLPEGVKEINKKPKLGLVMAPQLYKTCAIPR
ncbi:cytochrome P450 2J2-like [Eublepharis macularius]|uniref:Cytochrome P450 2J2-like n=1 Tax=Eublepharis macularius TaxID=481883 RepID=A0AA97JM94_EUBMA|nr:cytochrome P450 2J2-like [Eublepharis macularius]